MSGTVPSPLVIPLSQIRLDTVTTRPAAPDLTPGETYTGRAGDGRRWFAVGAADGIQLVDARGLHWPADVVAHQWGPLDLVRP